MQGYLVDSKKAPPVKDLGLKTVNLTPGQKTTGELWFARDLNAHELSMRLAIGDVVYDFPFSFKQKKERADSRNQTRAIPQSYRRLDPRGQRATLKGRRCR